MSMVNLNLARKWRSKNFDQIVGQDLSVRMLKNSLYLDQFFPVYLFSGQRGCGKTSTARIFAAAINCTELAQFQKNPKSSAIPCLECASCVAMMNGKHPDFFEIDAASHTGVDHIRQIIESSLLLPLMGGKKIYLIDEAHMLSKASFNALLKVLEEPPHSVVFILATTDAQKIIDTVKSRCFQLLFKPIESTPLIDHLTTICTAENINFDVEGLELIVKESDGSMRDAINVLEQVRFSSSVVSRESVLQVFGHLGDDQLVRLMEVILTQSPARLLAHMQSLKLESYSAEFIWHRLAELLRSAIWVKHGVEPQQFGGQTVAIKRIVDRTSWLELNDFLDQLHSQELLFNKTTAKHALLEMILLQMCHKKNGDDSSGNVTPMSQSTTQANADVPLHDDVVVDEDDEEIDEEDEEDEVDEDALATRWKLFVGVIEESNDPLLLSIFRQANVHSFDETTNKLVVEFSQDFAFFKDWLLDTKSMWLPELKKLFGAAIIFDPQFTAHVAPVITEAPKVSAYKPVVDIQPRVVIKPSAPRQQHAGAQSQFRTQKPSNKNFSTSVHEPRIDISDATTWVKAHMLLRHFSGTISEIRES